MLGRINRRGGGGVGVHEMSEGGERGDEGDGGEVYM